jgi:N-acetylglucosaminyldiphosphoundecaprenol N-acetyl-beta-D-mannosaminyltransferase
MPQRLLLVQLADIGDLVTTTPALHALREALPDAHLTVLTSAHAAPVIDGTDLVDAVITFDRQKFNSSTALLRPSNLRRVLALGRYDTVVYFHHFTLKLGTLKFWLIGRASGAKHRLGIDNGNGWFLTDSISDPGYGPKHQAQHWLDLVGLLGAEASPRPCRVTMRDYPLPSGDVPRVVIHAGSGGYSRARRWEPEKFAAVADRLHEERGAQIMLVGGKGDDAGAVGAAMLSPAHDLSGETTLPELASVIAQADLYIGADSGVMHIAAATGTPVVAVFGPSNHHAWAPWTPQSRSVVVRSDVECSPCSYVGHGIGLREGCPARTCMKLVTVGQVVRAASALLDGDDIRQKHIAPVESRTWQRIEVLGLPVDGITYAQWLDLIDEWVNTGERARHVCTINPEFTMIAQQDPNFAHILCRAALCVPDGVGMLWAARRQGVHLPERVTGSDGVPIIAARAAARGWRLFLLGAAPGIAEQTAAILCERFPGLQVVGTYSGSPAADEEDAIVERVNDSGADILFVAYGAPAQDAWIARNLPRLDVAMAMGVGGAFDFIAGLVPRAPGWMRRAGIEWLYRLYKEPGRIKRQTRLPRFVLAVLRQRNLS